jgi:hypothetical protein
MVMFVKMRLWKHLIYYVGINGRRVHIRIRVHIRGRARDRNVRNRH